MFFLIKINFLKICELRALAEYNNAILNDNLYIFNRKLNKTIIIKNGCLVEMEIIKSECQKTVIFYLKKLSIK